MPCTPFVVNKPVFTGQSFPSITALAPRVRCARVHCAGACCAGVVGRQGALLAGPWVSVALGAVVVAGGAVRVGADVSLHIRTVTADVGANSCGLCHGLSGKGGKQNEDSFHVNPWCVIKGFILSIQFF